MVYAVFETAELGEGNEFSGTVLFKISVYNQKKEIVTYIEESFYVEKRQKGGKW